MNFLFFLKNVLFFTYEYLVSTLNSSINCSPTTQGQLQFLFFFTHWKKQKKKQKMKDVWKVLSSENLEEVMISWSASDDTQASRSPMYIVVVVLSLCVYDKVTISCFCFFSFFFCNFPSCFRSESLCEIKYYFITHAASLWYVVKLQQLWRTWIEKNK